MRHGARKKGIAIYFLSICLPMALTLPMKSETSARPAGSSYARAYWLVVTDG
jgi:hypothetical protein